MAELQSGGGAERLLLEEEEEEALRAARLRQQGSPIFFDTTDARLRSSSSLTRVHRGHFGVELRGGGHLRWDVDPAIVGERPPAQRLRVEGGQAKFNWARISSRIVVGEGAVAPRRLFGERVGCKVSALAVR